MLPLDGIQEDLHLTPYQKDFLEILENLQLTASSRLNSNTDLNRIDETRGNFTVEVGEFSISEKDLDQQIHTHHNGTLSSHMPGISNFSVDSANMAHGTCEYGNTSQFADA